jgi:hypothetical protein
VSTGQHKLAWTVFGILQDSRKEKEKIMLVYKHWHEYEQLVDLTLIMVFCQG